ncbi:hypothetical protein JM658_05550 [Joostella atrarenae]|uniref:Uncharacterized protein n=1 Tax=Joostella atrarenae TaxID=679257 RepID=A0ABS9J1I3_9FLAO|nr:hypothetical protein [Joostella atrarenae]MCF8714289.1 hypothetical protein [Joostella atrarenae]
MSGPKVVRIVTPEEREIIKARWLTRLQHNIENLKEYAKKSDVLNDELMRGLEGTLSHYQAISADEYEKIEREVPNQIKYLKAEKAKLVKKVTKEKTSTWDHYRKLKSTLHELQKLMQERNVSFEAIEEPKLLTKKSISHFGEQVDAMYDLLKADLNLQGSLTTEQKEIQKRLSAGDSLLLVEVWSKDIPKELNRQQKFEQTLRDLYIDDVSEDKIQEFIHKVNQLNQSDIHYIIQLDSLILEAATFHKEQLELRTAKQELREALQLLKGLNQELTIIIKWESLITTNNTKKIHRVTQRAKQLYEEISETIIVETRRAAIEKALTKVGYEVNDNMETAWVDNGRLVVKKAKNSLYGVEFMSPKNLSRIQARVVADENRSQERSHRLDKHQEEIWCDDFTEIREILEKEDLSIRIEKANAVGAIPIKEVKLESRFTRNIQSVKKKKTL